MSSEKKQLQEGKEELEQKLIKTQKKLEERENQQHELLNEMNDFQNKLTELREEMNSELEKNKKLASDLVEEKDEKSLLSEKINNLEQIVEDLQKKVAHGLSSDLEENKEKLRTKQRELEEVRNQLNQEKKIF